MSRPEFDWKTDDVAVIREGFVGAGKELHVLGAAVYVGQWWVPVLDDVVPDEPTFYKEAGLRKKDPERAGFKAGDYVTGLWFDYGRASGVLKDLDEGGLGFENEDGVFTVEMAVEIKRDIRP